MAPAGPIGSDVLFDLAELELDRGGAAEDRDGHIEALTVLVDALVKAGADVKLAAANPLSTQDDIAAYLAQEAEVWAWKGQTAKKRDAGQDIASDLLTGAQLLRDASGRAGASGGSLERPRGR